MNLIRLGRWNRLTVTRRVDFGVYLDGGDPGEVLMPLKYVPRGTQPGDELEVFVYLDQQERLVATTETPKAQVGEFAYLKVAWVNRYGAFLDWGLLKDLFVPFHEQKMRMEQGRSYIVYPYIDGETARIVASAKVEHFLSSEMPPYKHGDEVNLLVWQKTDLGFKVIVENQYSGQLYSNEIFTSLHTGDRLKAFVKHVREDGKIDLVLQHPGVKGLDNFSNQLLQQIEDAGGFIPFTDKSSAEDIEETFGVSKKTFKRAVGMLYRQRLIELLPNGISLVRKNEGAS